MNARLSICLIALVITLPLAVAGCGNSGPLVLPEVAPADVDTQAVEFPPVDDTEPAAVDAVEDDPVDALDSDPIPEVDGTDDGK